MIKSNNGDKNFGKLWICMDYQSLLITFKIGINYKNK